MDTVSAQKILMGYSIVSPLHLVHFLAALDANTERFDAIYLFISHYWQQSILPARYLAHCRRRNIQIIESESDKATILANAIAQHAQLTIINVKTPSLKLMLKGLLGAHIHRFILIDEGIGSFAGLSHSLKASRRERGWRYAAKVLLLYAGNQVLRCFYRGKISRFSAFHGNTLTAAPLYRQFFTQTLHQLSLSLPKPEYSNTNLRNQMVFCSQPWVDLGHYSPQQYRQQLTQLAQQLQRQHIELLIKKHPADQAFDYQGFTLLDFDGIVEEWVLLARPRGIISTNSTASLLIPACFDIPSYLLSFDDVDKLSLQLRALFRHHCRPLSDLKP